MPFRHLGNANVGGRDGPTTPFNWDEKLAPGEKELVTALDQQGTTSFFHHGNFDLKFLRRVGFQFRPRCEDTLINATLINEWQGRFSLEACANVAGVQAKKGDVIKEHLCALFPEARANPKAAMGHYWRLAGDDPLGVEYAEGDGTTTWQLRDNQMLEIERQELTRVWDVESRLIPVLARMSCLGIKIDEERFARLREHVKAEIERLEDEFGPNFNPKSKDDVQWWMERHGVHEFPHTAPTKRFPDGQPSFTQGWLEESEPGMKIVKVRKLITLRDTFMLPLQTTHMFNGRVHTNYNQLRNDDYGTITGRLSCDSPNLQAVPKHDEEIGRIYRSIFVPDDGKVWAAPDYNQCEPRLLAFYSRCRVLMDGYNADPPLDAHTAVAIACNKNWETMNKEERRYYRNQYAKRINQTIITGGGKGVLVSKYKIPQNEVDKVWNDYFRAMPEVRTVQKKASARMRQRGYIMTLLGRRCRLLDPDKDYVALNRMLQGGNADIIKIKTVEVDEYLESEGRPVDILNSCHDATDFQFDAKDRKARKVYDECIRIMQDFGPDQAIKLDIPMPVDVKEGPDWAIATYGPEEKK